MDGLPFVPGFRFNDATKKDYHLSTQFFWKNGYALPKENPKGVGNAPLDVDSILYAQTMDGIGYDPTLTYGLAKDVTKPAFQSNFILLDGKCLSFDGFTKQTAKESPIDMYRVRCVKIKYFLVDDTISIYEPVLKNAGYVQGCFLKRGLVPNPNRLNRNWHWSDFNIGKELSIYGITYRLCSCDPFTAKFLSSKGIKLGPSEPLPDDPYMINRQQRQRSKTSVNNWSAEDKLKHFLEHDGKVLRFYAAWHDDGTGDDGEWKLYVLLYFLANDQVEIYQPKDATISSCSRDMFPLFLGKIKLPKDWSKLPHDFPYIYMEPGIKEYQEYYKSTDFIIGNTILVMGRSFFLYDCDKFTRGYYKDVLRIEQPGPINVLDANGNVPTCYTKSGSSRPGVGESGDTRQNGTSLTPKSEKDVDFVTYVLFATKKLRYRLKMVPMYEVDQYREFIMEFCLGNNELSVFELANKNSGFSKGRYLSSVRLRKPNAGADDNDQFYGPKDFAIGAELHIRGLLFKIVELDLRTYKFMKENSDMFTQEAIDGAKKDLESKGLLNPLEEENVNKSELDNSSVVN